MFHLRGMKGKKINIRTSHWIEDMISDIITLWCEVVSSESLRIVVPLFRLLPECRLFVCSLSISYPKASLAWSTLY